MLISKKFIFSLIITIILLVPLPIQALINLRISAPSALLIDADSGTILFEKNASLKIQPASLIKLMFIYMVFDKLSKGDIKLSDTVIVSSNAAAKNYRSNHPNMFLRKGEKINIEKLLTALTVLSANDAAIALAEFIYGSEEALVDNMNYMVSFLGLKNTHFTNITGYYDINQYTTAADIVILSRKIIKNFPQYLSYFKLQNIKHNNISQRNKNDLLFSTYPRNVIVDGLQIDNTKEIGNSIIFSALQEKTNFRIIGIIIGANSDDQRIFLAQGMLNWAYNNFTKKIIYKKGDFIVKIPVIGSSSKDIEILAKEDISYITLRKPKKKREKIILSYIDFIKYSFDKNTQLANIKVIGNGDYNLNYQINSEEDIIPENKILQIIYSPYYLIKRLLQI